MKEPMKARENSLPANHSLNNFNCPKVLEKLKVVIIENITCRQTTTHTYSLTFL